MTVRCEGPTIYLEGTCAVEEAEVLAAALESGAARTVDLAQCDHLHGAVVQTILRFRPVIQGKSRNSFVRDVLQSAIVSQAAGVWRNQSKQLSSGGTL